MRAQNWRGTEVWSYRRGFENRWSFKRHVSSNLTPSAMFKFFQKSEEPRSLKEVLKQFEGLEKEVERISEGLENLKKEGKFSIQKMGIIRYNPFSEVGGDQSFSVALLDGNNDGVVVTSLYSREGNRVYGKALKSGASEYSLSGEEKKAIEKAISSKIPNPTKSWCPRISNILVKFLISRIPF